MSQASAHMFAISGVGILVFGILSLIFMPLADTIFKLSSPELHKKYHNALDDYTKFDNLYKYSTSEGQFPLKEYNIYLESLAKYEGKPIPKPTTFPIELNDVKDTPPYLPIFILGPAYFLYGCFGMSVSTFLFVITMLH